MGHDGIYRRKRAAGQAGWDPPAVAAKTLAAIDAFLSDAPLGDRPSVLELGCGAGDGMLHFARKGWTACGVDISPAAIAWAGDKAAAEGLDATFVVGDLARPLTLPFEPVDLVLDGHCLHCIIGDDRTTFLHNARSYLRPGGLFCLDTMCGDPVGPALQRDFDRRSRCIVRDGITTRYLGRADDILDELERAGLAILKHRVIAAADATDQDTLLALARAPDR